MRNIFKRVAGTASLIVGANLVVEDGAISLLGAAMLGVFTSIMID